MGTPQDFELIGQQFVAQFYQAFDNDRFSVLPFYHTTAMMTFEDIKVQGHDFIRENLGNKQFTKIQHIVTKVDCQPTSDGGVIIMVTGRLKTDDDPPHSFSQMFLLKMDCGSYFIFHDIMRLSLHDTL